MDTATTEIYTYLHTLSLHDALPSSVLDCKRPDQAWEVPRQLAGAQRGEHGLAGGTVATQPLLTEEVVGQRRPKGAPKVRAALAPVETAACEVAPLGRGRGDVDAEAFPQGARPEAHTSERQALLRT